MKVQLGSLQYHRWLWTKILHCVLVNEHIKAVVITYLTIVLCSKIMWKGQIEGETEDTE